MINKKNILLIILKKNKKLYLQKIKSIENFYLLKNIYKITFNNNIISFEKRISEIPNMK